MESSRCGRPVDWQVFRRFEDEAEHLLASEPGLRQHFEDWKAAHPKLLGNPQAVSGCIFSRSQCHAEPEWRRYPVLRLLELPTVLWAGDSPPVTAA